MGLVEGVLHAAPEAPCGLEPSEIQRQKPAGRGRGTDAVGAVNEYPDGSGGRAGGRGHARWLRGRDGGHGSDCGMSQLNWLAKLPPIAAGSLSSRGKRLLALGPAESAGSRGEAL